MALYGTVPPFWDPEIPIDHIWLQILILGRPIALHDLVHFLSTTAPLLTKVVYAYSACISCMYCIYIYTMYMYKCIYIYIMHSFTLCVANARPSLRPGCLCPRGWRGIVLSASEPWAVSLTLWRCVKSVHSASKYMANQIFLVLKSIPGWNNLPHLHKCVALRPL